MVSESKIELTERLRREAAEYPPLAAPESASESDKRATNAVLDKGSAMGPVWDGEWDAVLGALPATADPGEELDWVRAHPAMAKRAVNSLLIWLEDIRGFQKLWGQKLKEHKSEEPTEKEIDGGIRDWGPGEAADRGQEKSGRRVRTPGHRR